MSQSTIDAGRWEFHAARVSMTSTCQAEGCGHRLDTHWMDDSQAGLSCDGCAAYCGVRP